MPTPSKPIVFILEPTLSTSKHLQVIDNESVTLSNEYGKVDTCRDLKSVLTKCGYSNVQITSISLDNYDNVISAISTTPEPFVVFNLCDGCESDGYPGISVLQKLHHLKIDYTGASPYFYNVTTSKPELKKVLIEHNVPTSPYLEVSASTTEADIDAKFRDQYPLIVKPSVSYASIAISDKSVVHSAKEALEHSLKIQAMASLKGAEEASHVFIERYLAGREYTVLITGSRELGTKVYSVAERVFNPKLGQYQRILAFDRYWDGYDLEGNTPKGKDLVYWYELAPEHKQEQLKKLALDAYLALAGTGYGRVDIRSDKMDSNDAYVLEVNANCGISFNADDFLSTCGEILKMSNVSVSDFANELISLARKEVLVQQ